VSAPVDDAAERGGLAFVQRFAHGVVLGQTRQHLVGRGASQAVQLDQAVGGFAHAGLKARGELRHRRVGGRVHGFAPQAQRRRGFLDATLPPAVGHGFAVGSGTCQSLGEHTHRLAPGAACALEPGAPQPLHRGAALGGQGVGHHAEQRAFLYPAAREGIERKHAVNALRRLQPHAPALQFSRFLGGAAGRAQLVEQHDHRLADEVEHAELGVEVAHVLGGLRGVDEVEHHVCLLEDVAHRALARPEGAVAKAVPNLAHEPAQRVAGLREAAGKARAVAEAGGVPQLEPVALGRDDHGVALGLERHVRLVAHLADVALQQSARQCRLAHVGVRHQAQGDRGRLPRGRRAGVGARRL